MTKSNFNTQSNLRLVALLVFVLGLVQWSAPALAQSYSFDRVVVQGNANVDAASILKIAQIERGAAISAAALNDALQRVNGSGLFEAVEFVPSGRSLTIRVVELPVINVLDFQGNKRLKDEDLQQVITSQARRIYSAATAEADAAAIAEIYAARGRLAATVVPKIIPRSAGRVDLVFEITEGRVVENESIAFIGNRAFSDRRLRQVMQTKQAGFFRQLVQRDAFDAERLDIDKELLRAFYLSRGYADIDIIDATAELSRERDATFISFTLREGPRYAFGDITLSTQIADLATAEFGAAMRLRTGAVYSPSLIEAEINRLENVAQRQGLNFVQVDPRITRNAQTQTIDVEFVLQRGERLFVERIDIEGNTTTIDEVVRRQFKSAEGDAFNPREVRQAAERIRALGFFAEANVDAVPGSSAEQVVVNVDVEEAPTGAISFGLTYGTNTGSGIQLGFDETNFLGRGQLLSLNVTSSRDTQEWNFNFAEPALLARDLTFSLNANYRKTTQAGVRYDTEVASISPAIEFSLNDLSRLELRYRYASELVKNISSTSSVIIAEAARGNEVTSSLGYTLSFDTRKTLGARGGVLLRFSQDFAGLGGQVNYISSRALAVAEQRLLGEEVTVRAVAEGGAISALSGYQTRVTDRFTSANIRGFQRSGIGPREAGDALGGNMFASVRFEAEFPVGLPEEYGIRGGAFLDMGSIWGLDRVGTAQGVNSTVRSSAGLSILWKTPVGPLRMNFSRPLQSESFDIGQNFELTISTEF